MLNIFITTEMKQMIDDYFESRISSDFYQLSNSIELPVLLN